MEKGLKSSKKDQKIAFRKGEKGKGQQKKDQDWQKKTEYSTIKPLSTIFVKM